VLVCACIAHCASLWYLEGVARSAAIDDTPGDQCIADIGFACLPAVEPGAGDVVPVVYLAAALAARQAVPGKTLELVMEVAQLMVFRSLCVAVTVLPRSDPFCAVDALAALHGGCHDKIFSGHIAYTTLAAFHLSGQRALLNGALYAPVVLLAVYLVASRAHYTIDVVIGAAMAAYIHGRRARQ